MQLARDSLESRYSYRLKPHRVSLALFAALCEPLSGPRSNSRLRQRLRSKIQLNRRRQFLDNRRPFIRMRAVPLRGMRAHERAR